MTGYPNAPKEEFPLPNYRKDKMTLEDLLRKPIEGSGIGFTPDFRVVVQTTELHNGVHIIIHHNKYNGETLDFIVRGNSLEPF